MYFDTWIHKSAENQRHWGPKSHFSWCHTLYSNPRFDIWRKQCLRIRQVLNDDNQPVITAENCKHVQKHGNWYNNCSQNPCGGKSTTAGAKRPAKSYTYANSEIRPISQVQKGHLRWHDYDLKAMQGHWACHIPPLPTNSGYRVLKARHESIWHVRTIEEPKQKPSSKQHQ